jgi:hypothetical protein
MINPPPPQKKKKVHLYLTVPLPNIHGTNFSNLLTHSNLKEFNSSIKSLPRDEGKNTIFVIPSRSVQSWE